MFSEAQRVYPKARSAYREAQLACPEAKVVHRHPSPTYMHPEDNPACPQTSLHRGPTCVPAGRTHVPRDPTCAHVLGQLNAWTTKRTLGREDKNLAQARTRAFSPAHFMASLARCGAEVSCSPWSAHHLSAAPSSWSAPPRSARRCWERTWSAPASLARPSSERPSPQAAPSGCTAIRSAGTPSGTARSGRSAGSMSAATTRSRRPPHGSCPTLQRCTPPPRVPVPTAPRRHRTAAARRARPAWSLA